MAAPEKAAAAASRGFALEIFAVSLAVIILEISYTRIFSFKLYYYFTYLIIGISLLGLGAGGVFVAIVPRLRAAAPSRLIATACLAGGVTVLAGYFVVAGVQLNAAHLDASVTELLKLAAISLALFGPFLAAGVVIATIFGHAPSRIDRLYCADLLGAGLGCASCIPLIYVLTPPGCVMLSGLVFALAALRAAATTSKPLVTASVVVAGMLLAAVGWRADLPDPKPDSSKTLGNYDPARSPVVFSRWSPVFRVDVMQDPLFEGAAYVIVHDGIAGSGLYRFDGDVASLRRFDADSRAYPFRVGKKEPTVLIIGAAGGHEILASLYFAARHVTGVELNPVTTSLLTEHFADYSGHIAEHERVTLVNAEGRSFLRRTGDAYDVIWLVAPDTYAAMNAATSGAYVLSESYLYTEEMIGESLDHLAEDGIICAQFGEVLFEEKPVRTARYLATARAALARRGIDDFAKHVLVATSPSIVTLSTVLVKKTPFTAGEVERFVATTTQVPGSMVRHAWGRPSGHTAIREVVSGAGEALERWYDSYPYDVTPVTDDSPFFWHFARFRDAFRPSASPGARWALDDAVGERLLAVLLAFVVVFAVACLLLPFASLGGLWREIPYKRYAVVYFAALGMGFMFLEVSLIQMLTLFLGYPSYSLSVTLFALLVFTGLGSLASAVYGGGRDRTLWLLFGALVTLVCGYLLGLGSVIDRFVGSALAVRCAVAVLVIAPLGLCLGAFMPIGLATVAALSPHRAEYVAWGWAVNGFASVVSAVLSTIVAMIVGFKLVLVAAVAIYLLGILALVRIPAPGAR